MTKQFFHGDQQRRPLRLCLWSEVKDKRLKRAFCLLYVGLQGIVFYGALEAASAIPSDVRPERDDSTPLASRFVQPMTNHVPINTTRRVWGSGPRRFVGV